MDPVDDSQSADEPPILDRSRVSIASALAEASRLLEKQEAESALTILHEICFLVPDHPVARAYLGVAWLQLGQVEVARLELEQSVYLAPNSLFCRMKYAEFLLEHAAPDEALAEIERALKLPASDGATRSTALRLRRTCVERTRAMRRRASRSLPRSDTWSEESREAD